MNESTSFFNCSILQECTFQEQTQDVGDGEYADDATWVLTASFVILTMQSGFGLLEVGSCMPGNEVNIMLKNVFDVVFGALAYYVAGYGISFGTPSIPFMGLGDFLPNQGPPGAAIAAGLLYSRYLFQFSFAATSTTIVSGCIAMRMRFFVYCLFSFCAVICYAFPAHWVWADDGWLRQMGVHDFAGAGPVHLLGAMNGLIAILAVGPRTGRFDNTRPATAFLPSSPSSTLFGLFILWWGWIGFNCGSSFGITNGKWLVATRAAINTINSSAAGGAAALLYTQIQSKGRFVHPDHIVNGILGALVSSTCTCASLHTLEALFAGFVGALLALATNSALFNMKIDDPVGAIGVHGAASVWGYLAVGLFADGSFPGIDVDNGLFRGGGLRLIGVQLVAMLSIILWSIMFSVPFFYVTGAVIARDWKAPRTGLRVSKEEELAGADHYLHDTVSPLLGLQEGSQSAPYTFRNSSVEFDSDGRPNKRRRRTSAMLPVNDVEEQAVPHVSEESLVDTHYEGCDNALHQQAQEGAKEFPRKRNCRNLGPKRSSIGLLR